jgi:hypothetical protein
LIYEKNTSLKSVTYLIITLAITGIVYAKFKDKKKNEEIKNSDGGLLERKDAHTQIPLD